MIVVERTLQTSAAPEAVATYLRDFANTTEWDDGTESCERLGDEPIAVGTQFRNVSRFAGRETTLIYTLVDDRPEHLRFEGRNKTAVTADDMTIAPSDGGTRLDYRAELSFRGLARLTEPVMQIVFRRLADRTERDLQAALDRLEGGASGTP